MSVALNHTIVWCHDKAASSAFMARMFDRPSPQPFMHFMVVEFDHGLTLDFMEKAGDVAAQHYAFLVGEDDFDAVMARLRAEGLDYWADPARTLPGRINTHDGGRGVYFRDPDGHLLEALTRPYGSGPSGSPGRT